MKRHFRAAEVVFIIVILITLIVCPGLYAAEETLPTPEEIIAKNIEAIGGIKALKKIKNRKIVSSTKIFPMNMVVEVTLYQERPDKDFSIEDMGTTGKSKYGTDGKIVWEIPPSGALLLEGVHLSNALMEKRFDGPDGTDVLYKSMKTEGIEQINGKACYKVVKTPEKGTERTVYYDKKSFMIVKIIAYNINPRGNYKREEYFEEYQKIDNILFPYKKVYFLMGQKFAEMKFKKIELNIDMPEGIFDIPEEVKAIMNKK